MREPAVIREYVRIVEERNEVIVRALEGGAADDFVPLVKLAPPTNFAVAMMRERVSSLTGEPCSAADAEVWLWWLRLREMNKERRR